MPVKSTEMSIAGTNKKQINKKQKKKKQKNQHVNFFFGRLGIEEPEHLRMR